MGDTDAVDLHRRALLAGGAGLLAGAVAPGVAGAAEARHGAATVEGWTSHSPFLTRAFAPVADERDDIDLVVDGELPRSLNGMFVRNGPNPMFAPDPRYAYPFDGAGMLHAVHLDDGKARYRNRWVATKEVDEERKAGRRLYNSSFSPPPHANLSNTNIVRHAGRHLSLYEGGVPYEVDERLATRGPFDFGGRLPGFMSAHPKQDARTGELLAVAYDLQASKLTYLRVDRQGVLDRVVEIDAPWAAMVHDIAITESHVVACLCPLVFDLKAKGPPATWQPERGAKIALIPRGARKADEVRWISCDPFFNFHAVNAFDDAGKVHLVVPWYDAYTLTHDRPVKLELHRMTIDLASGQVDDRALDDRVCEFGRVDDRRLGRRARYGYVGLRNPRPDETSQVGAFEAFARYDLETGAKVVHVFPAGATVCEPVFVPKSAHAREDEGYILSFVHREGEAGGAFVVLDAAALDRGPVVTVRLPRRVPAGLHGSWLPA